MANRYWYLNIEIRNGEYEHNSKSVHMTKGKSEFDTDDYLKNFYGDDGDKDGDCYYFNGGEIACSISDFQEITKEEYDVLRKFI